MHAYLHQILRRRRISKRSHLKTSCKNIFQYKTHTPGYIYIYVYIYIYLYTYISISIYKFKYTWTNISTCTNKWLVPAILLARASMRLYSWRSFFVSGSHDSPSSLVYAESQLLLTSAVSGNPIYHRAIATCEQHSIRKRFKEAPWSRV